MNVRHGPPPSVPRRVAVTSSICILLRSMWQLLIVGPLSDLSLMLTSDSQLFYSRSSEVISSFIDFLKLYIRIKLVCMPFTLVFSLCLCVFEVAITQIFILESGTNV